jgi:hypothetical protein
MRRIPAAMAAMAVMATLSGGCGGGDDDTPPTTVTTQPPAPTTTIPQGDAKGIACLNLATEGLKLFNDYYEFEARGVRPPNPEPYRVKADELRAEQARLGCPGELLKAFP